MGHVVRRTQCIKKAVEFAFAHVSDIANRYGGGRALPPDQGPTGHDRKQNVWLQAGRDRYYRGPLGNVSAEVGRLSPWVRLYVI